MTDPREPLGRIFHEQGRLTVNDEREKPFGVQPWEGRTEEEKELDMRGASAVAAEARRDAEAEITRLRAQVMTLTAWLPTARQALLIAAGSEPESVAKHFRAAYQALGGGEEDPHA